MYLYKTQGKSYNEIIPDVMNSYYKSEETEIAFRFEILLPYLIKNQKMNDLKVVLNVIEKEQYSNFNIKSLEPESLSWFLETCWDFIPALMLRDIASNFCHLRWDNDDIALSLLTRAAVEGWIFENITNIYFYPFSKNTKNKKEFQYALTFLYDESFKTKDRLPEKNFWFVSVVAYAYQTNSPELYYQHNYAFIKIIVAWLNSSERNANPSFSVWLAKLIKPENFTVDLKSLIVSILYCEHWLPEEDKELLLRNHAKDGIVSVINDAITRRTLNVFWEYFTPAGVDRILELIPELTSLALLSYYENRIPFSKKLVDALYNPEVSTYLREHESIKNLSPSPFFSKELNLIAEYNQLLDTSILEDMIPIVEEAKHLLTKKFNVSLEGVDTPSQIFSVLETLIISEAL